MSLGLEEVYELGLLRDGPLHFHLLMGVHSLQVELSEHPYCHEFLLKYFTLHRESVYRETGCTVCCGLKQSVGSYVCLLLLKQSDRAGKGNKTTNDRKSCRPTCECTSVSLSM